MSLFFNVNWSVNKLIQLRNLEASVVWRVVPHIICRKLPVLRRNFHTYHAAPLHHAASVRVLPTTGQVQPHCWDSGSTMTYHILPHSSNLPPPLCTVHALLISLHPSPSYLFFKCHRWHTTLPDPSSLSRCLWKSSSTISSTSQTTQGYLTTRLLLYVVISPQNLRFLEDSGCAFSSLPFSHCAHIICCLHSMPSKWLLIHS